MADLNHMLQSLLQNSPVLSDMLSLRWTTYIPDGHTPSPKQRAFLLLPHREALFGGAAGGGKSDALLMAALQYVDIPGYSAILFRRRLKDLSQPDSLLSRAHDWLAGSDAKWNSGQHEYIFPTGAKPAKIAFGYLDSDQDKIRYQGAQYQFVGFDELTQIYESDYRYMFSRLRKPRCPRHAGRVLPNEKGEGVRSPLPDDPNCGTCREYAPLNVVPIRMRAATNPGGIGHNWVRQRFSIKKDPETGRFRGMDPRRPFIASFIQDNPAIDLVEYRESLSELDPVTRDQLEKGDWDAAVETRFRKSWIKRYSDSPAHYILGPERVGPEITKRSCVIFTVVDPAATTKEGPGDKDIYNDRRPSATVIGTFAVTPNKHLLWLDTVRVFCEVPDILTHVSQVYRTWKPQFIGIENSGIGLGVFQTAQRLGLPITPVSPRSNDKLARAHDAMIRMEQGRIWFPEEGSWLEEAENEIFSWVGHPKQEDDHVDVLAYAAILVSQMAAGDYDPAMSYHTPQSGESPDFIPYGTGGGGDATGMIVPYF
jgi:phage terminase large subunit-like protein